MRAEPTPWQGVPSRDCKALEAPSVLLLKSCSLTTPVLVPPGGDGSHAAGITPAPGSSSLVMEGSKDPRLPTLSHSSWSPCHHPGTLQRQEQAGELCYEQSVAGLWSFSASAFGNGLSTMAGHPESLPLPVPWGLLWQPLPCQGMLRAGAGSGAVLGCGAPNLLRGGITTGRSAWGWRPAGAVSPAQRRGH